MHNKTPITVQLRKIKERHGITTDEWAEKSGVPAGTIARYLSSSLNIPNFPYVCAMLKCLGESIDAFYDAIDKKIDEPAQALRLDAVPTAVIGSDVVDLPENKTAMQERLIIQAEDVQAQRAIVKEKDAQIEVLQVKVDMYERIIEEKDRTLEKIEQLSQSRLKALQVLCSAQ